MKHQKCMTENKIETWLSLSIVFFLLSVLFVFTQTASAQGGAEVSLKPLKINGKEVKEYLIEKYGDIYDVDFHLIETPDGPKGKFNIRGKFIPKAKITAKDKKERSRKIAQAFIQEEPSLFGVTKLDELKEYKIDTDELGYTHVTYQRYVEGVLLGEMVIMMTIAPNEKISVINANVIPLSKELQESIKKTTISKEKVLKIVEEDLISDGIEPEQINIHNIRKIAIQSPPHVIWTVSVNFVSESGRWGFTIDAFTGEILIKRDVTRF